MNSITKAEKIIQYLDEIQNVIHNKHHELAQKYNLTVEQFHGLLHLNMRSTPPTVNEIAHHFNNAQNTMSEKLSRLEEKGLIMRVKDSSDKRVTRVALTAEGKKLVDTVCFEAENKFVADSISKMEVSKLDNIVLCLEALLNQLKED